MSYSKSNRSGKKTNRPNGNSDFNTMEVNPQTEIQEADAPTKPASHDPQNPLQRATNAPPQAAGPQPGNTSAQENHKGCSACGGDHHEKDCTAVDEYGFAKKCCVVCRTADHYTGECPPEIYAKIKLKVVEHRVVASRDNMPPVGMVWDAMDPAFESGRRKWQPWSPDFAKKMTQDPDWAEKVGGKVRDPIWDSPKGMQSIFHPLLKEKKVRFVPPRRNEPVAQAIPAGQAKKPQGVKKSKPHHTKEQMNNHRLNIERLEEEEKVADLRAENAKLKSRDRCA